MIWFLFAAWVITAFLWHEAWQYAKQWEQIAAQYKYTAEMWEDMYQGERDHV